VIKLTDHSRMGHYMLCVCHTTPAQNGPVCSLLSVWATTTGRLLGPKMVLGVFLKDTSTRYRIGVEKRFRNLRLLARRTTNWGAPPLTSVTTNSAAKEKALRWAKMTSHLMTSYHQWRS